MARGLLSPCAAVSGESLSIATGACACVALGGLTDMGHPHAAPKLAVFAGAAGALVSFTAPTVDVLAPAHLASTLSASVLPLAQAWAIRRVGNSCAAVGAPYTGAPKTDAPRFGAPNIGAPRFGAPNWRAQN
jgi:hypothetical protein